MAHEDAIITVELLPNSDGAEIRLDDFLEQMAAIKAALRETERYVSGGNEPSLYLQINTISKNSPIHATLEAKPEANVDMDEDHSPKIAESGYASKVVRTMTTNLRVISRRRRLPVKVDMPVLESYRKIASPAEKYGVAVKLEAGGNSVTINKTFREILDSIVGDDEFSYGSVSGRVEGINIHEPNRRFWLYPTVGANKIMGTFRARDRDKFAQAVNKYVTVYGRLSFKSWDKFPYAVFSDEVTFHDLVDYGVADVGGIAPGATGDMNSREFVDALRDDW